MPAHGSVDLKPGSYHVMLNGLTKLLVKGEKVLVTLTFESKDGEKTSTEVQADVRDLTSPHAGMKMN